MKVGNGAPLIDGVQIGEVQIDALSPNVVMSAKFAYVYSKTSARLGYCHSSSWSPNTLAKLGELLESMEQDVVDSLFEGGASPGGESGVEGTTDGVPGL